MVKKKALADPMETEFTLAELRKSFEFSQEDLANALDVTQANISKIERRDDVQISTLVNYVRAVGGEVEILVHFPDKAKGGKRTIRLKPLVGA